jgi:hypothetical protein
MNDYEVFDLGDVVLQEGATLREAKLAYKTYGTLNEDRSNVIVYPTWYSGSHWENEWLIGERMALDPSEYFIIVPNMLGNGLSSSPSRALNLSFGGCVLVAGYEHVPPRHGRSVPQKLHRPARPPLLVLQTQLRGESPQEEPTRPNLVDPCISIRSHYMLCCLPHL